MVETQVTQEVKQLLYYSYYTIIFPYLFFYSMRRGFSFNVVKTKVAACPNKYVY